MTEERTIRATELLGREAVDIAAGAAAGCVREIALGADGALISLGIQAQQWYLPGLSCPVSAIAALLEERVLIRPGAALELYAPAGLQTINDQQDMGGRRLICLNGGIQGPLSDLRFRLSDGCLLEAYAKTDAGECGVKVRLVTALGPDCLIIEAQDEDLEKQRAERQRLLKQELGNLGAQYEQPESAPEPLAAVGQTVSPLAALNAVLPPTARMAEPPAASTEAAPAAEAEPVAEAEPAEPSQGIGELLASRAWAMAQAQAQKDAAAKGPAQAAAGELFPQAKAKRRIEQLPLFEQRKAQYLLGKPLRRDVFSTDGALLCPRGYPVDDSALDAMIESGVLESVFLEMTTVTR